MKQNTTPKKEWMMAASHIKRKRWIALCALLPLSAAAVLFACWVGVAKISLGEAARGFIAQLLGLDSELTPAMESILFDQRLPRVLLVYLVGATLSVTGGCLQGLFKNPMAESSVLGVSAGAGFGATLAIVLGLREAVGGLGFVSLFAFAGGLGCSFLVYALSRVRGRSSSFSLLLSGIAVSSLFSSGISLLMYVNHSKSNDIVLWMMGGFSSTIGWVELQWAGPLLVLCLAGCMLCSRTLNILSLGETEARFLGVEVGRFKPLMLLLCALGTSAAVSVSGAIGFVGLMIPHAVRLYTGPDHRLVLPVSLLAGGIFLVIADIFARLVLAPQLLPVGILTALCGGPYFLYLLHQKSNQEVE